MIDQILNSFLARQALEGRALAEDSGGSLRLLAVRGDPPSAYVAEFFCAGLARVGGRIVEQPSWAVGISFPADYLRRPVDSAQMLTYLGPAPEPWHPNIALGAPFICMHVGLGCSLVEILYGLYELLTWNLFATGDDGLNRAASQWARNQDPRRFPVDRRPLKRGALLTKTRANAKGARS